MGTGASHYKRPRNFTTSTKYIFETKERWSKTYDSTDHGQPAVTVKKKIMGKMRTFQLVEYKPCLEQYEVKYREK